MWEFIEQYAESFWVAGDFAWHVFEIITAWALTIGFALFIIMIISGVGELIKEAIKERFTER